MVTLNANQLPAAQDSESAQWIIDEVIIIADMTGRTSAGEIWPDAKGEIFDGYDDDGEEISEPMSASELLHFLNTNPPLYYRVGDNLIPLA